MVTGPCRHQQHIATTQQDQYDQRAARSSVSLYKAVVSVICDITNKTLYCYWHSLCKRPFGVVTLWQYVNDALWLYRIHAIGSLFCWVVHVRSWCPVKKLIRSLPRTMRRQLIRYESSNIKLVRNREGALSKSSCGDKKGKADNSATGWGISLQYLSVIRHAWIVYLHYVAYMEIKIIRGFDPSQLALQHWIRSIPKKILLLVVSTCSRIGFLIQSCNVAP
jgi:hypothetical protein